MMGRRRRYLPRFALVWLAETAIVVAVIVALWAAIHVLVPS